MAAKREEVDPDADDDIEDIADDADATADEGKDLDAVDAGDDSVEPEPKYAAGEIPDSQLDATRLYLNEIG
jgi:RNA polymerase nonessential primary-like sigma factor